MTEEVAETIANESADTPITDEGGAAENATPEPVEEAAPQEQKKPSQKPWFVERISEITAEKQKAETELAEYKALADKLKTQGAPPTMDEAAIEARAQQLADQRLSHEKISAVANAGVATYDDWRQRTEILEQAGAASPQFVLDVANIDPVNAHKIFHALSDDPAKAMRLARMDARSRTVELVRMSMSIAGEQPKTETKPAPKTVSKAPVPPPPVDGGAKKDVPWYADEQSDAEFSRNFDKKMAERAQRRG
jgi:hypothetical protein